MVEVVVDTVLPIPTEVLLIEDLDRVQDLEVLEGVALALGLDLHAILEEELDPIHHLDLLRGGGRDLTHQEAADHRDRQGHQDHQPHHLDLDQFRNHQDLLDLLHHPPDQKEMGKGVNSILFIR